MKGIVVRRAKDCDVPEIMRIIHDAFLIYMENGCLPSPPSALFETESEVSDDIRKKCVLAAEVNGRLSGTLRLDFKNGGAYLSRFAVDPSLHRSGIGKALLDFAVGEAVKNGCTEISLHTSLSAKNLVRLYRANGFSVCEINTSRGYRRAKLVKIL